MIRHISTYVEGGRTFYICKEIGAGLADGYWAFEDKMLDENGCLARRVNGLEGHHRETLGETIQSVSCQVRFDAMLAWTGRRLCGRCIGGSLKGWGCYRMANTSLVERINQEIAFQRKMAKEYESGIYKNDIVTARYDQAAKILEWVSGLVAQDQEKPDDVPESKINEGGMLENKIKVNEGYKITASETYTATRTGQESRVVLARKETAFGTMYVTWESTAWRLSNGSEKADYYWGHYFDDENKARADYHKRLAAKYEG